MWTIEAVEISGGFLSGLKIALPPGLTCIIGPRGSGKSTLAEAIRYAILGSSSVSKARMDLLQANLGPGSMVSVSAVTGGGKRYMVRRQYRQEATLLGPANQPISSVELERGTFLPLDYYTGPEIEAIADESLGEKRRALLDELQGQDFRSLQVSLGEHRRALESNAAQFRELETSIADIKERIEEMGDPAARLETLGPAEDNSYMNELTRSTRQQQLNSRELSNIDSAQSFFRAVASQAEALLKGIPPVIIEQESENSNLLAAAQSELITSHNRVVHLASGLRQEASNATAALNDLRTRVSRAHAEQAARLAGLSEQNAVVSANVRVRAGIEEQATTLRELKRHHAELTTELERTAQDRMALRAAYLEECEKVSVLREAGARSIEVEAGPNVRVRVMRNADALNYQQLLSTALHGARVRNHEDILASLLTIRPEHLAQFLQEDDLAGLEALMGFGVERSQRIFQALRQNLDPLTLEVAPIDDRIRIELNVSPLGQPTFRDASELSRGQKCTALLPILMARRDSPLVIDQPEDNLDNHFIYETVVNAINRLKPRRQMLFITHNANIPVLGEAALVIVLDSDGKVGFVKRAGDVDSCRNEIVDLLEGGREAFELRRQRYGEVTRG